MAGPIQSVFFYLVYLGLLKVALHYFQKKKQAIKQTNKCVLQALLHEANF